MKSANQLPIGPLRKANIITKNFPITRKSRRQRARIVDFLGEKSPFLVYIVYSVREKTGTARRGAQKAFMNRNDIDESWGDCRIALLRISKICWQSRRRAGFSEAAQARKGSRGIDALEQLGLLRSPYVYFSRRVRTSSSSSSSRVT